LIDGNKTYVRYLESLDKSKIFIVADGVQPFFELLQDLEYIELVEQVDIIAIESVQQMRAN
jgi:hypothetical protein